VPFLFVLLLSAACGPDRSQLEPIPPLDLAAFDELFAGPLRERKVKLDEALGARGIGNSELAKAFADYGKQLHAAELLEPARACYRNAERLAPRDHRWPYYLGQTHQFTGEFEEAAGYFEQSLSLEPDDLAALVVLGDLYFEQDEFSRAEALFLRALALGEPSAPARFGLGQVYAAQGENQQATEHFEAALALVPAAQRIHYHLGVIHGRLGDREKAEAHMARQGPGIPLPPDPLMDEVLALKNAAKRRTPGSEAFKAGRLDDALEELRAAEAADPEDPVIQLGLGTVLATQGELEQAEAHLRKALELNPDRLMARTAHLNLGNMFMARGLPAEAAEHYRTVIGLDPETEDARLAQALIALGRPDEAEPHYRTSLAGGTLPPTTYVELATALSQAGRFEAARWVYDQAREALPRDGLVANSFARFLASCPDDAVRDGETALDLARSLYAAGRTGPHAVTLAMALAENGLFARAIELQRNAIAEAERLGREDLAGEFRRHLALYEQGKPLRQP
jgi:tetratricopeptide (TPR) repeat protein